MAAMASPEAISRRAAYTEQMAADLGVDEALIARLVHGFYDDVRADPVLGPIFAERIADWGPHLVRMTDFWSSVMLMTGRYHGQPMVAHAPLPIDAAHFDRWLALFEAAARRLCAPAAADALIVMARRFAESLELGVAGQAGTLLRRGERFRREPA
jgi:hemoglobin